MQYNTFISILMLIWLIGLIIFSVRVSRKNLTINYVVGYDFKKLEVSYFLTTLFPIFYVTKLYVPLELVQDWFINKTINLFIMACIFYGLDTFPKFLCWTTIKLFKRMYKSEISEKL